MSIRLRWLAWRDLWQRYSDHWRHFWSIRQQLTLPAWQTDEAAFLPAALAVQAAPVSPTGRQVARLLILLVLTALSWAIIGHIDIIVNAQGKIIPGGHQLEAKQLMY